MITRGAANLFRDEDPFRDDIMGKYGGDDPYTGRSTSKNRENSFSLEEEIVVKDDTKPTASATSKESRKQILIAMFRTSNI